MRDTAIVTMEYDSDLRMPYSSVSFQTTLSDLK